MSGYASGKLSRQNLLRRIGKMSQLSHIRPFVYEGGKSAGIKAFEVSNGTGLDLTVLESKCLDIVGMKYKGVNLNYSPKSGRVSSELSDMQGTGFMRSIPGGMLYTCGLQNVGAACVDEGVNHVFHGNLKATPADHVSASGAWEGDEYVLRLSGEMTEATIFNEHLVLRRELSVTTGGKSVLVRDEVENQGFSAHELMLLYHVNIGYPVLDEGSRVRMPSFGVYGKDEHSIAGIADAMNVTGPIDGFGEQVYQHRLATDSEGKTAAAVINDALGLGVYVKYDTANLPHLVQWKSMRSGDYALGLFPSTCFVNGRAEERANGTLLPIGPFEKRVFEFEIGVLDGGDDIATFDAYVSGIANG